jgi:hypothetical protein
MDKRLFKYVTAVSAVLVLAACSEAPKPATPDKTAESEAKKEPPKPPEAVAAQSAFYEMYKPARTWATDLLPISLASDEVAGVKNADGKAGKWVAVFVSPSLHQARTFTYAVASDATTLKGVNVGGAQSWSGPTPKMQPFQTTEFVVNSDAAYKAAYAKGEEWVKKHPDAKVTLALGSAKRFPAPVWYVLWGNEKNGFAAYVNATTGTIVSK